MSESAGLPAPVKLIIGVGGIYSAFLYYGSLQEGVFRYTAQDGSQFKQAWFLQVLEALDNVIVGFFGMQSSSATKAIPKMMFAIGASFREGLSDPRASEPTELPHCNAR